jgi:hypothetical protein
MCIVFCWFKLTITQEEIALPDSDVRKGRIPLVVTPAGNPLRELSDCAAWVQSVVKTAKIADAGRAAFTDEPVVPPPPRGAGPVVADRPRPKPRPVHRLPSHSSNVLSQSTNAMPLGPARQEYTSSVAMESRLEKRPRYDDHDDEAERSVPQRARSYYCAGDSEDVDFPLTDEEQVELDDRGFLGVGTWNQGDNHGRDQFLSSADNVMTGSKYPRNERFHGSGNGDDLLDAPFMRPPSNRIQSSMRERSGRFFSQPAGLMPAANIAGPSNRSVTANEYRMGDVRQNNDVGTSRVSGDVYCRFGQAQRNGRRGVIYEEE